MDDLFFSKSELLDSLLNAVFVTDTALTLRYMNQSAEEMIGRSFSHIKNRPIQTILTSPQFDKHIEQALSSHQRQVARSGKITVRGAREINIDCTVTPLLQDDVVTGILFELNQVDRQIRIARENRLVSTQAANQSLLRGIAHEIKNPLGGLRGAAQLLELQHSDNASIKEYTHVIITEADRLSKLVDSMLVSHQSIEKKPLNIHQVLEHVRQLSLAKCPHGITLKRDYDPSIPEIMGNFDQLVQTTLNLLNNAITSIENSKRDSNENSHPYKQGEIALKTRVLRNFTVHQHNHPLALCVQVIDNGAGIPEDLQDKIFFPMVTGHADGTGLGLSIAQTLINQHKGLIEFESRPHHTVFSIIIPIENNHDEKRTSLGR